MISPQRPMPTEAAILEFMAICDSFYPPDAVSASIAQQRQWYDALCARFDQSLPKGLHTRDDVLSGSIPVRRYYPADMRTETILVYLHGGGFVVGSLESHHAICAEIADNAGAELIAVDYRLAPEHWWPTQTDDCFSVLKQLLAEEKSVVLIGDSAGGNLAAGLAIRAKADGLSGVVGQILIYPALGGDLVSGSYHEMAEAPGLTTADVAYYRSVLRAPAGNPVAEPLASQSVAALPPTFITVAHYDPLRDDGRNYAARLAQAGVEVWFREEPQMVHAWLRARHMSDGARTGFAAICAAARQFAGTH